jgi:hypothetical protein
MGVLMPHESGAEQTHKSRDRRTIDAWNRSLHARHGKVELGMQMGRHLVGIAASAIGAMLTSSAAWAYYGIVTVRPDAAPQTDGIFDAPMAMLKSNDPSRPYWFTSGAQQSYKFQGPLESPWETTMSSWPNTSSWWISPMPSVAWPNGETGNWNPWMCNIYKHGDGRLIGFVHLEDQANNHGGSAENFKIGIAYSTNGGSRFTYLGDIIDEANSDDLGHNIKGAPYIIRSIDGIDYFYLYFNDKTVDLADTTSVARAKVSDVMAAAANGAAAQWKKYYNGLWDENGIRGRSTSLDTPYWVNTHSDIAYSTTLQKYVWASATGGSDGRGNGVALLFSSDGLSWTGRLNLVQVTAPEVVGSYASIGALNGADSTAYAVGSSFDVYWRKTSAHTLGRASVFLSNIQPVWNSNFNFGGAPGWSTYQDGGQVHIDDMIGTFDKNLHLYDQSTINGVSAVRGFAPVATTVTVELEFHLSDDGSRQNFRIKGNGSSVSAVHVYAWSGKLYWMNPAIGGGTEIAAGLVPNLQYSLKIRANAATDRYDVYFDGAPLPTVAGAVFWTNVSTLDSVAVGTDGPGLGDAFIDDVWVYQ